MPLALVDTNILVYRFDSRYPGKQKVATEVLRRGLVDDNVRIPHQAVVEFVRVITRRPKGRSPLLPAEEARREAEDLLSQFEILYPNEGVVRNALRGAATYQLPWWDAHLWAYAECYGLEEILSEDLQHGRFYGRVRITNPFL